MSVLRAFRCAAVLAAPFLLWTCGKADSSSGPPAGASQLSFKVDPVSTAAGAVIFPAVVVEARDAAGKLVKSFSDNVTVSLSRNPGNATLNGTTTVAAVGGLATFPDLSLDHSGSGYRFQATSGALTSTSSSRFDVVSGGPTHLAFAVEPGTDAAGTPIAPAVQVTARDSLDNIAASFTGLITVAISGGTGTSGAVLSGQASLAATAGVATFTNLSIDKIGAAYTLTATTPTLPGITSAAFDVISGPAAKLVFTSPPTTIVAGNAIAPSVEVTAKDAVGNVATSFNGTITVSISSGTGAFGATLSGTKTVLAGGGVATLADLSINKTGSAYTLTADATGLVSGVSAAFDVLTGPMTQLSFSVQPAGATAGTSLAPAIQVSARDAAGNTVTSFTDSVTMGLGANPTGGALSGTLKAAAASGVATFSDLSLIKAGAGYRLQATSGPWVVASNAFSIQGAAATQFTFLAQPTTSGAGLAIAPPVQVEALDAYGNVAATYAGTVDVAIGTNPGGGTLGGSNSAGAAGGIATFLNLSIDKLGTGYTLTASASGGGLTGATSAPFNIVPGAASQLSFTVPPVTTVAGATIPSVQVTALDAFGNPATGFTGTVTVSIGTNPGSGGLAGTKAVSAVAGVATFADLSIGRNGTGYTLTAKATGLGTATSPGFDIQLGPVAQLVFAVQPATTTAGTSLAPAVQVVAQDAAGNTEIGFTNNVTLAIGINPGGGTLSGTTTVAAVGGVATFNTLTIDKTGVGYRLAATSGNLNNTSGAFSILPGTGTRLVIDQQPVATPAGGIITPAVDVTVEDALGNVASTYIGSVTIAIGANPGGGTLAGTKSLAVSGGFATFFDLSIDKIGSGYTLTASAAGLTGVTSTPFDVTAGGATQLVFTVQPSTVAAGAAIAPAIQVTAKDGLGNVATGFTGSVTVAIGTNPAGGSLAGTKTIAAVAGVATFSDLTINRNGAGYTLTAKSSGITQIVSTPFDVLLGAPAQLVFAAQPQTTSAGTVLTAVKVAVEDGAGNTVTSFTNGVTLSIGVNPGGGTLGGTTTVAAVAGVATYSDLTINKSGTGYRLLATAGAINNTSGAFSITGGAATHLAFTVQPGNAAAAVAIAPAVKVTALDSLGNTATSFTGPVAIALGANPGSGTLSGTTPISAVAGVATFSDLSINKLGNGYTIVATSAGLTGATSTAFNIVAGGATQLVFSVQPTTTTAGVSITPAVKVTALDGLGNVATSFTGNVTVAIGVNPSGGTLSGTKTVAAVLGVATFSTLNIDFSGTGYTLNASANGVTGTASTPFTINPGTLTQLGFVADPPATTAGAMITPAVKVEGEDAFGNPVPSFTGSVTLVIAPGTGTFGATLSGTTTVSAVAGVATFSNLSIDKSGLDYRLDASSGALTGAETNIFAINAGAATRLSISQQPTSTAAGSPITPAVTVSARDALGNLVKTFTANVTVAIAVNPSTGILSGTKTVAAVAGVATFANLSIDKAATGYRLSANSGALTPDTSSAFSVTAGVAAKLVITVQPSNALAGATIAPAVQVSAQDALGNVVTTFINNVGIAISAGTGTAGATLGGTLSQAAAAGIASFGDLHINLTGTGYKLVATAAGLTSATTAAFAIN